MMTSSNDLAGSELRFGRQLGWPKMMFHRSTISNKITSRGMAIVPSIECIYLFSFRLLLIKNHYNFTIFISLYYSSQKNRQWVLVLLLILAWCLNS